ncbi:MAG: sigma-E processing peptidase SpoIIGA [Eubacterium sp.]|nr:sigma-E processing peptidase SpoIIGA [Eubacterium sp.]NBI84797.1 hypothetical protein [Lachnospiraceae bacterium]
MNYEFYVDVFFLTNFYLDFWAVYAVSEVLQQKRRLPRAILCCASGSLAGCILFLALSNYDLYVLCIHFIVNPVMVVCCFFPAGKKIYVKAYLLMYFIVLLLGGSMEWLYHTVMGGRYYELCLVLSAVPVLVFLFILRRKRKNVQRIYPAAINHQGKTVSLLALYDTGNTLYDPYLKEPVHIIANKEFESLGGKESFSVRLIPFSSVGCGQGMLEAFTVECLTIKEGDGRIVFAPAVLAAAEDALFKGRPYRMILHCSISDKMPLTATQGTPFKTAYSSNE